DDVMHVPTPQYDDLTLDESGIEPTFGTASSSTPTLELDAAALGLRTVAGPADAAAPMRDSAAAGPADDEMIDLSIDESLLAAIDAPAAVVVRDAPAHDPDAFAGLDADLLDMPELPPGEFARLPDDEPGSELSRAEFADTLRDFGFLDDAPDAPRGEEIMDLDTLLLRAGEAEAEKRKGSLGQPDVVFKPKPVTPAAARPAAVETKPAPDAIHPPALASAAQPSAAPVKPRSLADFEQALSGLSLEPTDDVAPAAPAASVPKPAAPKPAAPVATAFESSLGGLSLEPIEGEAAPTSAPASGRAVFAVAEPVPARPAAVAAAPTTPKPAGAPDDELALEGYDFNFDENTEISTDSIVRLGSEPALDDLSVDMDSELDALLQREAGLVDDLPDAVPAQPRLSRVFVLGASIGGPDAVREFVAALPAEVPVLFLLAQHMGADFLEMMVQQLTKASKLKVRTVADGDLLAHGEIVVVPPALRLQVDHEGRATLGPMPGPSAYSPSIDQVMCDVADAFGTGAGAIIFSGMAHDAIEGARRIVAKGGVVWVQDPASCVISSMVDGAREAGVVSYTAKPAELARHFLEQYPT
ncbi:MAG TPA: chemotaxis protein CheB, partial [Candidatus Saccharimonadia bacterium]|nr:chemotaxis protein CheB [Candidatus Saccharimonadia bacterium]